MRTLQAGDADAEEREERRPGARAAQSLTILRLVSALRSFGSLSPAKTVSAERMASNRRDSLDRQPDEEHAAATLARSQAMEPH